MKLIYAILLIGLLGSFSKNEASEQKTDSSDCGCGVTQLSKEHLASYPVTEKDTILLKEVSDEKIKSIRNRLCMNVISATSVGFDPNTFKKVIFEGLGLDENISNGNQIVSEFLNTYKQQLVCPKDASRKNSRDLHLYKAAILGGVIDLFDEILLDDDEYEIDLNAFEIVDSKKETVLDYIDKLIATNRRDNDELELLKDDIEELGGKRGAEL
jgi:hypothetical protein